MEQLCLYVENNKTLEFKKPKKRVFNTNGIRGHSKSIGDQVLLLIHGLKPHIDLFHGPTMKFYFL
jgi:hypothetical protein